MENPENTTTATTTTITTTIQRYQLDDVNLAFIKLHFGKVPTVLQGEPLTGSTKQKLEMPTPSRTGAG